MVSSETMSKLVAAMNDAIAENGEEREEVLAQAMVAAVAAIVRTQKQSSNKSEERAEPEEESPRSKSPPLHPARVAEIKKLIERKYPAVGEKRKRTIAFTDFDWTDIRDAYEVNGKRLRFTPTLVTVPESDLSDIMKDVRKVLRTSQGNFMEWQEGVVVKLVDRILTDIADIDNTPEAQSVVILQAPIRSKETQLNGRADLLLRSGKDTLIVVECKRAEGMYLRGMAQMVREAEILLSEKLAARGASEDECVYGLLAQGMVWTWFRLDSHEGRFHETVVDTAKLEECMREQSGIAYGFLKNAAITKSEDPAWISDKNAKHG